MDGWDLAGKARKKTKRNPKYQKHVMERACADSDMEPAWASWQDTEDMAFTRPFSGASQGRQTVLLGGWGCGTEARGLERETHVHGTANRSLCLSHYLTKESWLKIQELMADIVPKRNTEQGISCLPLLSPCSCCLGVFHRLSQTSPTLSWNWTYGPDWLWTCDNLPASASWLQVEVTMLGSHTSFSKQHCPPFS